MCWMYPPGGLVPQYKAQKATYTDRPTFPAGFSLVSQPTQADTSQKSASAPEGQDWFNLTCKQARQLRCLKQAWLLEGIHRHHGMSLWASTVISVSRVSLSLSDTTWVFLTFLTNIIELSLFHQVYILEDSNEFRTQIEWKEEKTSLTDARKADFRTWILLVWPVWGKFQVQGGKWPY